MGVMAHSSQNTPLSGTVEPRLNATAQIAGAFYQNLTEDIQTSNVTVQGPPR